MGISLIFDVPGAGKVSCYNYISDKMSSIISCKDLLMFN